MQRGGAFGIDLARIAQRAVANGGTGVEVQRRAGRHRHHAAKVGHRGVGQLQDAVVDRLQRVGVGHRVAGEVELAAIGLQRPGIGNAAAGVNSQNPAGRFQRARIGDAEVMQRIGPGRINSPGVAERPVRDAVATIEIQRRARVDCHRAASVENRGVGQLQDAVEARIQGVEIGQRVVSDRAVADDVDQAQVADRPAVQRHPAQVQRLATVDLDGSVVGNRGARYRGVVQRQRCGGVHSHQAAAVDHRIVDRSVAGDMNAAVVGDGAAGHRGLTQGQRHAGVDRQLVVAQLVVADRAVAGDLDNAEIDDLPAANRHPAQLPRHPGINLDYAGIGDDGTRHRGAVQRQRHAIINQNLAAIQRRIVDRAVADDMDGAAVGNGTASDDGVVERQRLAGIHGQLRVAQCFAADRTVTDDLYQAEIDGDAAAQKHPAQVQRLAVVDLDRAVVGNRGAGDRGAVQRQDLGGIHRDLSAIERRIVDRTVAGDMKDAVIGDDTSGNG